MALHRAYEYAFCKDCIAFLSIDLIIRVVLLLMLRLSASEFLPSLEDSCLPGAFA
jgi:hypothetical protein